MSICVILSLLREFSCCNNVVLSWGLSRLLCCFKLSLSSSAQAVLHTLIYCSMLIFVKELLQRINELPYMNPINKRMLCLNGNRNQDTFILLIVFSPVKQRSRIVLFPELVCEICV